MLKIRILAAIVSILSLATLVLALVVEASAIVPLALLAAAACLAIVAPFDAPSPPRRNRILLACLAYLVALSAALIVARGETASGILMVALVILVQLGVGLTCWTIATRNRRRMPHSRRYFDN